ncbi:phosphoserine phosphatase SerB [Streptococcus infantis]|uniref:phosphoserine phosphatase SerB n=1 Tax=Streptococcus infantis TaxID=68892 RepID=UPI001CC177E4|nr:phosphoserine phosphatase SerB [Streptococcus infantis]MBZ2119287.1 phosphoserine phosphatase SerB [Streptococcus infantis]MBZ2121341.1 phosphoserine phosphatase SerB [Streptococcus infantis]MBZ2125115.1 phosphoserine phosphatase SerB [Streptococcus infantis]
MNKARGLCVLDVDGTLIEEEVIDLLGKEAGCEEEVVLLTAQAMRGELDFEASLKRRVSLLKGLSINSFDKIYHELHLSKNAVKFIKVLQENKIEVSLVSGGFTTVVERLAKDLGISLYTANQLEIKDDHLTGNLICSIISREVKEATLVRWAEELEVPFDRTIAIGDGANDLKMLKSAGLGIAFCAKDIVKKEINLQIDERDFGKVLEMIDFL